jgi:autotransporter-associated beta strand protein
MLNANIVAGPASMAEAVPLNIPIGPTESSGISKDMIVPQPISNPVGTYGSLTLSDQTSNGVEPLNSSPPLVFTQGAMLPGTTSFTAPSTMTGTIAVAGGALTVRETATLLGGGNIFVQQGGNLLLGNRHLNAPLIVGVVGVPLPESNASSLLISAPTSASGGLRMVGGGIGAGVVNIGSGMLTLNGTNSYTGATYLASGSLVISGSAPLSLTLAGAQKLTNAISYVTTELVNSTLETYPPVSLSSGIGTLSISSGITTSGGTLVFAGSSSGTGN